MRCDRPFVHTKTLKTNIVEAIYMYFVGSRQSAFFVCLSSTFRIVHANSQSSRCTVVRYANMWTTVCLHFFSSDSRISAVCFPELGACVCVCVRVFCRRIWSADRKTVACDSHIQYLFSSLFSTNFIYLRISRMLFFVMLCFCIRRWTVVYKWHIFGFMH